MRRTLVLLCCSLGYAQQSGIRVFEGLYQNWFYFFKAVVPPGYQGRKAAPPAPQHGFVISIAGDREVVDVSAYYDAVPYETNAAAVSQQIRWLTATCSPAGTVQPKPARLSGYSALEYGFDCRESQQTERRQGVVAIITPEPDKAGILFTIDMKCSSKCEEVQRVFAAVRKSFVYPWRPSSRP